ncbi:YjbE family putative metal transport protein [Oceanospirillaceae bacterium]|jgi:YjbE family integral membrane protein|nr:YjbE family putative metal transport protein [Oceanospirillaceae bacterium]MBT5629508.1 YjbE family putative metal transport protein [Oceanospirillaceae bacterium]MBT6099875.1 YjbE family putative metal transport protein [Oceanospirillaceae bacterium]MDB0001602.1 YjbE family putative metal transport protein [Oceanospirillaceae bacterium]MDB0065436.1 YjbE family putative metal transport protein [Oceanospirillaceae bacterium]
MFDWSGLIQIMFADIILSGDNALVIGMVAAGIAPEKRRMVLAVGMGLAAFFRIVFAAGASYIIDIPGILIIGGLLLAWVCWRFYHEIVEFTNNAANPKPADTVEGKDTLLGALFTIAVADISMSLDNVVAVAAIAREDTQLLIFGLIMAIVMMAFFASMIMRFMLRYPWVSYMGLFFLVYLTIVMLYDGVMNLLSSGLLTG